MRAPPYLTLSRRRRYSLDSIRGAGRARVGKIATRRCLAALDVRPARSFDAWRREPQARLRCVNRSSAHRRLRCDRVARGERLSVSLLASLSGRWRLMKRRLRGAACLGDLLPSRGMRRLELRETVLL
jgi:hypothetical protein